MDNQFNQSIASGSTAVTDALARILFWGERPAIADLDKLERQAIDLLHKNGWLDMPLLIEELHINAETALNIMRRLKDRGLIVSESERV